MSARRGREAWAQLGRVPLIESIKMKTNTLIGVYAGLSLVGLTLTVTFWALIFSALFKFVTA